VTKLDDRLIAEVNDLVESAGRLSRDAAVSGTELGPARVEELTAIAARGGQLILRLYGVGSQYDRNFQAILATPHFTMMHSNYYQHVSQLAGILQGAKHDLEAGMLFDIRRLVQAEVFVDFIEMSEYLLDQGYKDASAVLLGAVLEDSLRKLAESNGVPTNGSNGRPLTMDPLNAGLAKSGVYGQLIQKQVTSWANLRNDAAHGNSDAYDADQVRQMLLFVQKFCGDYLG